MAIAPSSLQDIWTGRLDGALTLARRTLEIASWEAMIAPSEYKSTEISDWKRIGKLGESAITSLKLFANALATEPGMPKQRFKDGTSIPLRTLITYPIHHMRFKDAIKSGKKLEGKETLEIATNDAKTIGDAILLLEWLNNYSKNARREISANYQNPGSPQKRRFAKSIMEGWIFLTGKKPSASNTNFCEFLRVAWGDVCKVETDWVQAIRSAANKISKTEVINLTAYGPVWK